MIEELADTGTIKMIIDTKVIMVYTNCEEEAQNLLTRDEKNGKLILEGNKDGKYYTILVGKFMDKIAEDLKHCCDFCEVHLIKI